MKHLQEALTQFLMDSSEQGIFITDASLVLIFWNKWMEAVTGKTADEVMGRKLFEVFPELTERSMDRFFEEALGGAPVVLSQRFHGCLLALERSPDHDPPGPMRQSARIAPLFKGNQVVGTITLIEDVTERFLRDDELHQHIDRLEHTEGVLRDREAHFRCLIENATDLIAVIDDEGTVQYVSPSVVRILGLNPASLIGQSAFHWIHPEDARGVEKLIRSILRQPHISRSMEGRVRHNDGSWIHLEGIFKRLPDEKGRPRIVVNARDITARRKAEEDLRISEEKYRLLFSNERDAVVLIDAETLRFMEANEAAARLFSCSEAELLGMKVTDVSDQPQESLQAVESCLSQGSVNVPVRWMLRRNGERFAVESSAGLFKWRGRNMICAIYRDITERLKMEEALLQAKKLEATGLLAGGIAHDFNNLLSVILGNLKLIQMDLGRDRPEHARLKDAEEAAQRAAELTAKFLSFARGGAPRKDVLVLGPLIADLADLVFSGSDLNWRVDIAEDLWPSEADPRQLREALYNVLINAREACSAGKEVTIRAFNEILPITGQDSPSERGKDPGIKIVVCDYGMGISRENLSRIFDPYFSTKMRGIQKGMGLGLTLAHSIIRQHGGRVAVRSEPGRGTTVEIWLPKAKNDGEHPNSTGAAPATGWKVLLMDDEEMFRKMAAEMLLRLDCGIVETAVDGDEAVEKFRRALQDGEPFDLAILDLTIRRGRGGKEVIGELMRLDPEVKAVVTSGYSEDPVVANFADYGFMGALAKPFQMADLRNLIHAAVSGRTGKLD